MGTFSLGSHFNFPELSNLRTTNEKKTLTLSQLKQYPKEGSSSPSCQNITIITKQKQSNIPSKALILKTEDRNSTFLQVIPRSVVLGAASIGIVMLLLGLDEHKALALGPEGPLVEEFWDNMRRYGLFILTVSTGVAYTILEPIIELLRNPITAILIVVIFGGSFYIVSQVLSAMVGTSEFNYQYGY